MLQVKKLHKNAVLPKRSTDYAAGYDLYALDAGVIPPRSKSILKTGIAIRLPILEPPYAVYGSIRSRSGLSAKHNLEVGAGVIDFDYTNEICVILHNHSDLEYAYKSGDRIAQLVLEVNITPDIHEVPEFSIIESTRTGGFGSTGL